MSGNASRTRGSTYTVDPRPRFDLALEHQGQYAVVDRPTGIFGQGLTPLDALRDFHRAARDHLNVLEGQAHLSPALVEQRDYLRPRVL